MGLRIRALVATLLLTASCDVPQVELAGRACDSVHPCVSGYLCVEGRCEVPSGIDASAPDAGSPGDAEIPDATEGPDGQVIDAGEPSDAGAPEDAAAPVSGPDASEPSDVGPDASEPPDVGAAAPGADASSPPDASAEFLARASLATGQFHSCALKAGELWCWGDCSAGQLGLGNAGRTDAGCSVRTPTRVGSLTNWVDVSAGRAHTCGIRADDSLYCFGANDAGELGVGTFTPGEAIPQQVAGNTWQQVCAGTDFSCAVDTDAGIWCFGSNNESKLGIGGITAFSTPQQVDSQSEWAQIACGDGHACALREDGTMSCWGADRAGELGTGNPLDAGEGIYPRPQDVVSVGVAWRQVSAGTDHTCAISAQGGLYCWGSNKYGQLGLSGDGGLAKTPTPSQVGSSLGWRQVSSGHNHTCAVRSDGTLWCWGDLSQCAFGVSDAGTVRLLPLQVAIESDAGAAWVEVRAGTTHTCGRRADDSVWCAGENGSGQLGLSDAGGCTAFHEVAF